ncbi:MAG TPA: response regulator, partial [Planctomycetota bacterium]|nr:response regulator [Planctomycetota bacterium]
MAEPARGRVLVVEDDQAMRQTIEVGLQRRRFETASSADADHGLETLRTGEFEAVVTDLNLRGMGGIELCARVQSCRPDVP